jgi:hypothetical protein
MIRAGGIKQDVQADSVSISVIEPPLEYRSTTDLAKDVQAPHRKTTTWTFACILEHIFSTHRLHIQNLSNTNCVPINLYERRCQRTGIVSHWSRSRIGTITSASHFALSFGVRFCVLN